MFVEWRDTLLNCDRFTLKDKWNKKSFIGFRRHDKFERSYVQMYSEILLKMWKKLTKQQYLSLKLKFILAIIINWNRWGLFDVDFCLYFSASSDTRNFKFIRFCGKIYRKIIRRQWWRFLLLCYVKKFFNIYFEFVGRRNLRDN